LPAEVLSVVSAIESSSSTSPEDPTWYLRTLAASLLFVDVLGRGIVFNRIPAMNFPDAEFSILSLILFYRA
jgi:hypothetical protein